MISSTINLAKVACTDAGAQADSLATILYVRRIEWHSGTELDPRHGLKIHDHQAAGSVAQRESTTRSWSRGRTVQDMGQPSILRKTLFSPTEPGAAHARRTDT
jgi:hypothetical protein